MGGATVWAGPRLKNKQFEYCSALHVTVAVQAKKKILSSGPLPDSSVPVDINVSIRRKNQAQARVRLCMGTLQMDALA
jgi:hypothetical protein